MKIDKEQESIMFALWQEGYKSGAAMRWPEMVFWIALVMFLLNLAVGGE